MPELGGVLMREGMMSEERGVWGRKQKAGALIGVSSMWGRYCRHGEMVRPPVEVVLRS